MKKTIQLFLAAVIAVGIMGVTGCSKNQERFEDPPWLGGSSIETLESRENYTSFLKLMEKANYTEPISKQLFTLFVPDDAAFEEYFSNIDGKSSVDDLTEDEAIQLFTLHVLRNPRSRFYLIYEYAWSELQTPKAEYASLFHRKPTPSASLPYEDSVRYVPGFAGQVYLVKTGVKNVPLWTHEFFGDFGGDQQGSDYLYMYPGSTWEEGYPSNIKGMNWHNAAVIPNPEIPEELEVRTASGFIYFLDRVVPPMPSIEEYMLANQDKYGLYYDILQRFAEYTVREVDEQRRVLYRKSYDLVFDLAEERGPSTNTAVPPQNMWTAFLPPNNVLQDYLDNSVLNYYESIDSVPRVTLFYILQSQLSGYLTLKSSLDKGYFNAFGDAVDISVNDLASGYMCSNGVVYETKRVLEPNVFKTVPGLLFIDKNYSTLLYALNQANMLTSLSNPDADVTLFATSNEDLEAYGIRYNETSTSIERRGPVDGKWSNMKTVDLVAFAQDQIHKGLLDDLGSEGGFVEMSSGNFIKYGNNMVYGGENFITGEIANVQDIVVNELNGLLVKVDKPIENDLVMGKILAGNDDEVRYFADPELSDFAEFLSDSRLLDHRYKDPVTKENVPNLKFLAVADYWTAFLPTNTAMQQAKLDGIIPEEYPKDKAAKDSVNAWIYQHFVRDRVIFDDGKLQGKFNTNSAYFDTIDNETKYVRVTIANSPNNLSVTDKTGQVVNVAHENANILVEKGVVHKINTVLKYYDE